MIIDSMSDEQLKQELLDIDDKITEIKANYRSLEDDFASRIMELRHQKDTIAKEVLKRKSGAHIYRHIIQGGISR